MPSLEKSVSELIGSRDEHFSTENLIVESIEELIKEEIKDHIRKELEENEELRREFKESVDMLMEAKMKEAFAYAMIAKSSADLGLEIIPPKLKKDMKKKLSEMLEKEMGDILME